MQKSVLISLLLICATPCFGQQRQDDFSHLDPNWAVAATDRNFQSGESGVAWAAMKRDFPDDYRAFLREYAMAIINHGDRHAVYNSFLSRHTQGEREFAIVAPDALLKPLVDMRFRQITHLATYNIAACAAVARGRSDVLATYMNKLDGESLTLQWEQIAGFLDAAAAGHLKQVPRRVIGPHDIEVLQTLIREQGASSADANAVLFSLPPSDDAEACRLGLISMRAMAAAPASVAAKFAIPLN